MSRVRTVLAVLALVACSGARSALAQGPPREPEKPTNLQVLPKDISNDDLDRTMRQMSSALGVRCDHCHAAAKSGQGLDFASDTKDEKKSARTMLQMTRTLNTDWLTRVMSEDGGQMQVSCVMCHKGSERPPRPLDQILADAVGTGGPPAAIAKYREMKKTEVDNGQYDFRGQTLVAAAGRLRDAGKGAEAVALVREGEALFSDSASYFADAAGFCLRGRDLACAEAELTRALELDPKNPGALRGMQFLQRMKAQPQPKP
jgi:hypothetical protein